VISLGRCPIITDRDVATGTTGRTRMVHRRRCPSTAYSVAVGAGIGCHWCHRMRLGTGRRTCGIGTVMTGRTVGRASHATVTEAGRQPCTRQVTT
jgi:hypothetical protein